MGLETEKKITTTESGQRPKRRNKDLSIKKLLKAGLEIFSKVGFEAATTKQIAKRAGMNDAMIIRYFKSKAGLLQAIILNSAAEAKERANAFPPGATLEEEIATFLRAHAEGCFENRDFHRIAISRLLVDRKLAQGFEEMFKMTPDNSMVQRFRKFQDQGEISRDRDLLQIAYLVKFEALGMMLMTILFQNFDTVMIEAVIQQAARTLALGLKEPQQAV